MVSIFVYLGISAMALIMAFVLIRDSISRYKNKKEPENQPFLWNYMPQQSEGHVMGVISDMKIGKEKIMIKFFPRDLNYIKMNQNNETPKEYTLFYDKRQVVPTAQSEFSGHRTIIMAYPTDPKMLPEKILKEFPEIAIRIEKNNALKDQSELLEARLEKVKDVAMQSFGGEVFSSYIESTQELLKDKGTIAKQEGKIEEKPGAV